jgi:hypothetical protein
MAAAAEHGSGCRLGEVGTPERVNRAYPGKGRRVLVPGSTKPPPASCERSRSECDDIATSRPRPYIGVMQHLDLSDDETAALAKELDDITRK